MTRIWTRCQRRLGSSRAGVKRRLTRLRGRKTERESARARTPWLQRYRRHGEGGWCWLVEFVVRDGGDNASDDVGARSRRLGELCTTACLCNDHNPQTCIDFAVDAFRHGVLLTSVLSKYNTSESKAYHTFLHALKLGSLVPPSTSCLLIPPASLRGRS